MQPAPLGKRFAAFAIDFFCLAIVIIIAGRLMNSKGINGDFAMWFSFMAIIPLTLLICWIIGNTPGKKVCNLHIVDEKTGDVPSIWQLVRRSLLFSLLISFNIVFLIPVLISKKRRAFHDMLAGTMVIAG